MRTRIKIKSDVNTFVREEFIRALQDIDPNSSPGCCEMKVYGTTNRECLGIQGGPEGRYMDPVRVEALYRMVIGRIQNLFEGNYVSDNLLTFVKDEPTKLSKIETKRWRLISGVSLVDTMVDRILLQFLFEQYMDRLGTTPVAIGWNPYTSAYLFSIVMTPSEPKKVHPQYVAMDKSCWDWTVQTWLLDAIMQVFIGAVVEPPDWWVYLLKTRFYCLFEAPTFEFQDGFTIKQKEPGIMKSGCYMTLMANSIAQVLLDSLCAQAAKIDVHYPFWCCGDDTIQMLPSDFRQLVDYINAMERYSYNLKVSYHDEAEFVGSIMTRKGPVPAYQAKHCWLLQRLTLKPEDQIATLRSYQIMYANEPEVLAKIRGLIDKWNIPEAYITAEELRELQQS
ncbi:hypothetical protein 2 [Wenzhou sobemo-like virus 2]|uniref:hypothetical protein 2 n=1 Tax=Wenzhou sobemo-like virus 2 TaxID=1923658 RepID=UPI00090C55CA|nr:hypothetical protein 2 [Wenzhou sobemo-like virus 2]APG75756.1 hypothetical protein 2 [Wenzhou sobemo-like virus 2]